MAGRAFPELRLVIEPTHMVVCIKSGFDVTDQRSSHSLGGNSKIGLPKRLEIEQASFEVAQVNIS